MPKGRGSAFRVLPLILILVLLVSECEEARIRQEQDEKGVICPPRIPGGACIDTIVKGINISLH